MFNRTQILFRWLGFNHHPARHLPSIATPTQSKLFAYLRMTLGVIWLYNTWTASSGPNKFSVAHFLGEPMSSWQVHLVGNGIVLLDLYIALVLLSGKGMRSALWISIVYLLGMWIGVEHLGDFDPATGATDAGIAPPYLIAAILTYTTWRISQPISSSTAHTNRDHTLLWAHAVRYIFGFLWAWDALFKWHPYFLSHFLSYLIEAQKNMPGWEGIYVQTWIDIIKSTSPLAFGFLAAITEAVIAWSLLSGKFLRYSMPVGIAFSFMVWSTAESFGGPYSNGETGMPGNMFGNAVMYIFIFIQLMVLYRWPRHGGVEELENMFSENKV